MRVILWDIDGTLLNFLEAEKEAIRACFSTFNLGECTDKMLQTYSKINRGYWERLERGEISKKEVLIGRFREFFEKYHLDISMAERFNAEYQVRLGDTICFNDNGLEIVKACKEKVLQYAVTNGTKIAQDRKLKQSGLIDLLDGVFISDEIGIEKPSIGFFEEVFRNIEPCEKKEIMIVGDSLSSDMQGGINAEIVTCWYNPERKENDKGLKIDYEIHNLNQIFELINGER